MFINSQKYLPWANISRCELNPVSITDRDIGDFIPRRHRFRSSYDIFFSGKFQRQCQFALWLQREWHTGLLKGSDGVHMWTAEAALSHLLLLYSNQETQLTSLLTNSTLRACKPERFVFWTLFHRQVFILLLSVSPKQKSFYQIMLRWENRGRNLFPCAPFLGVNRCHASTQISTIVGHTVWLYNSSLCSALRITTSFPGWGKVKEMRGRIKIPGRRAHTGPK